MCSFLLNEEKKNRKGQFSSLAFSGPAKSDSGTDTIVVEWRAVCWELGGKGQGQGDGSSTRT